MALRARAPALRCVFAGAAARVRAPVEREAKHDDEAMVRVAGRAEGDMLNAWALCRARAA